MFVTGLFSLNQDIPAFKEHLRDFLVQIKVSVRRKHQLDRSVTRAQFCRLVVFFFLVRSGQKLAAASFDTLNLAVLIEILENKCEFIHF